MQGTVTDHTGVTSRVLNAHKDIKAAKIYNLYINQSTVESGVKSGWNDAEQRLECRASTDEPT